MQDTVKIEKRISIAMRIGVSLSAAIMVLGFVLLLITNQDNFTGYTNASFIDILKGLIEFNPYSIMLLGIFFLILTPVFRVLTCIILFAKQKDRLYTAITILVLMILAISFTVGYFIH